MSPFIRKSGLVALTALLAGGIVAAKLPTEGKQYDYVTVERLAGIIHISEGYDKYEKVEIPKNQRDNYMHHGALYRIVNSYEARGYELFSTQEAKRNNDFPSYVFVLRKPK